MLSSASSSVEEVARIAQRKRERLRATTPRRAMGMARSSRAGATGDTARPCPLPHCAFWNMRHLSNISKPSKKEYEVEEFTEFTKSGWGKKIANARALANTDDVFSFSETHSTPAESAHFFRHVAQQGSRGNVAKYLPYMMLRIIAYVIAHQSNL